jgi:hypothetical protein
LTGHYLDTILISTKDVVDSDKKEITKEFVEPYTERRDLKVHSRFSLKFQQIVQREQESNFISKLHRGRIHIIPWPVIESSQFYTTFNVLKKCLDKEKVSHPQAGVFLLTLKTLMAKLKVCHPLVMHAFIANGIAKANDWGSMSRKHLSR